MSNQEMIEILSRSIRSLDLAIVHMELCDEAEEVDYESLGSSRDALAGLLEELRSVT